MRDAIALAACALLALVPLAAAQDRPDADDVRMAPPVTEREIDYAHDGVALRGLLVQPSRPGRPLGPDEPLADGAPVRATILIVHQWRGLGEEERERARMLARLGYRAFALDMYGAGVWAKDNQEASRRAGAFYADRELMRGRVAAAIEALDSRGLAEEGRLGAIGYCFGGTVVLECARAGMDLDAVVSFHGGLRFEDAPEPGQCTASVLVCNGNDDPLVPVEERRAFIEQMEAADADFMFVEFADAVHSFTSRAAGEREPGKAVAYNARADRRSWAAMRSLFEEVFAR